MDTVWQLSIPETLMPCIAAARSKANAGMPATVEDDSGNQIPNPDLFATDFAYFQQRMFDVLNSWEKQRQADEAATPDPDPVPVGGVPQEVTRRQALQQLAIMGLLDTVVAIIDAIPDATQRTMAKIEWDESQTFQRNRPLLVQLALGVSPGGLGLTAEQLDQMFVDAAKL